VTVSKDFPKTTGGAQPKCNECSDALNSYDAFVARLNSNLTQILQSTYLGGSESDLAYALAIHPQTGESTWRDIPFPTTFLKLLVGRRPSATSVLLPELAALATPLWQG
jgi:hypothetical protein